MKADEADEADRGRSRQMEVETLFYCPAALGAVPVCCARNQAQTAEEYSAPGASCAGIVPVYRSAHQRAGRIGACGHGMRVCMPAQQHTNTKDSNNTTIMILYNKITSTTSNKITKITSTTSNIPTSSFLFLWLFLLWCSVLAGLCPCCFL